MKKQFPEANNIPSILNICFFGIDEGLMLVREMQEEAHGTGFYCGNILTLNAL